MVFCQRIPSRGFLIIKYGYDILLHVLLYLGDCVGGGVITNAFLATRGKATAGGVKLNADGDLLVYGLGLALCNGRRT